MTNRNEVAEWSAVDEMISAAKMWFEAHRESLKSLLHTSNSRLAPLGEPLLIDFGAHRWLRKEREEAYSDWLAWIIEQLPSAVAVFQLLRITPPANANEIYHTRPKAEREEFILDNTRRLDIRIRFGTTTLIVVEVKTGPAESADIEKNRDYNTWANNHGIPHKVLLVTEAEKTDYHGFKPIFWADICVSLRKSAHEILEQRGTLIGAMVLAFVGAVEQNLLGFSAPTAQTEGAFSRDWPRVADHIRHFLGKEDDYGNPRE